MSKLLLGLLALISLSVHAREGFPDNLYPKINLAQDLAEISPDANDPFVYPSDFKPNKISIEEFSWVTTSKLPEEVKTQLSNNNVSITVFENRLFLALRTGKTHFASKKTRLYVISSLDGQNWDFELDVFLQTDLREPQLTVINNELHFVYFKGGSNPFQFKPSFMYRYVREKQGEWADKGTLLQEGEVPWEIKTRQGISYLTSYRGSHYNLNGKSAVDLMFQKTLDGFHFTPASDISKTSVVYKGGVSEAGWEFDHLGNLWAVTRNEDGDDNGFGSQVMFASKDNLNEWKQIGSIDRECYMSPKMFRVGEELYLIGRKNLGEKPFMRAGQKNPLFLQRIRNWVGYTLTGKGTAIYKINKLTGKIDFVMDLPGHGDNSFPSIYRLNEKEFLVSNYSSALWDKNRPWIVGQLMRTNIYLLKLKFN